MTPDLENYLSTTSSAQTAPAAVWTYDQMANYLVGGYWTDQGTIAHHYSTASITFNLGDLTTTEQNLALGALSLWDDVTNISFVAAGGPAQINFNHDGSGASAGTIGSWNSSGITSSSTIDITQSWVSSYGASYDGYSFQTYVHEIGHALGLGHAGDYNSSATYGVDNNHANDTWQFSIMSYFSEPDYSGSSYRFVETPQIADIVAIDSLYGASTTTRLGDTTYGFHASDSFYDFGHYTQAPALTLFDSGGSDTLDGSGYSQNQSIDLQSGHYSSIGGLINNIGISTNTVIENAIGGSGDDTMVGNSANNTLTGGPGGDYLDGGAGFNFASYSNADAAVAVDMLYQQYNTGDAHGDTLLNFQAIVGSNFSDGLFGTEGNDVLYAGAGNDTVYGRGGNDVILGNSGNDVMDGGAGNDTVYGSDYISLDHDTFVFDAGDFGHDVIQGFGAEPGANQDALRIDHTHFASFSDVIAHASQMGTDVVIADGPSNSIDLVAVNIAHLSASNFFFV